MELQFSMASWSMVSNCKDFKIDYNDNLLGYYVCYINTYDYDIYNDNSSISTLDYKGDEVKDNAGMGILAKYAQYNVSYRYYNNVTGTNRTLSIKCESNGKTYAESKEF